MFSLFFYLFHNKINSNYFKTFYSTEKYSIWKWNALPDYRKIFRIFDLVFLLNVMQQLLLSKVQFFVIKYTVW